LQRQIIVVPFILVGLEDEVALQAEADDISGEHIISRGEEAARGPLLPERECSVLHALLDEHLQVPAEGRRVHSRDHLSRGDTVPVACLHDEGVFAARLQHVGRNHDKVLASARPLASTGGQQHVRVVEVNCIDKALLVEHVP